MSPFSPFLIVYLRHKATKMAMPTIEELLREQVHFKTLKRNELHYETDSGFRFVVPLEEIGDQEFPKHGIAKSLARWIIPQYEVYQRAMRRNR